MITFQSEMPAFVDRMKHCKIISLEKAWELSPAGYGAVHIRPNQHKDLPKAKMGYLHRKDFGVVARGAQKKALKPFARPNVLICPMVETTHGPFPLVPEYIDYLAVYQDGEVIGISEKIYQKYFFPFYPAAAERHTTEETEIIVIINQLSEKADTEAIKEKLQKIMNYVRVG